MNQSQKFLTCSDVLDRSGNSIAFLRFFLATLVVFHHSFTLRLGYTFDPLARLTKQVDLGTLAVGSFLILSGFLIAASYDRSKSLRQFALNRFLRLYPAFWVCLLVSVLVLGPLAWSFERGTLAGYFSAPQGPVSYVASNISLFIFQTDLAGLFSTHHSSKFNGSLWTLPLELTCYLTLPLLSLVGGIQRRCHLVLLCWLLGWAWYAHDVGILEIPGFQLRMFSRLKVAMFFASGVLYYAYRDKIPLNSLTLAGSLLFVGLGAALGSIQLGMLPALPLLLCWLAVRLPFRYWDRRADLSYGTYIYAYPIQQLFLSAWPAVHPLVLFLASMGVVLPFAMLSWFWVEKPALSLKRPTHLPKSTPVLSAALR